MISGVTSLMTVLKVAILLPCRQWYQVLDRSKVICVASITLFNIKLVITGIVYARLIIRRWSICKPLTGHLDQTCSGEHSREILFQNTSGEIINSTVETESCFLISRKIHYFFIYSSGRRGRDRMAVGFTIIAYHH